ncbi:YceD family protein [Steroidobacter flavus]|uniref:Large ribosomal RNA subunit accumulation protein YceD n=1 Tax=Steroidobacter flavus TaxID=1842136 RepID=A0ABV8SYQ8_9GAMM
MPRPPAVPADNIVDAEVCARAGSTIARRFSAAELPRLREAGGQEGSWIEAEFQFSLFDGKPAVAGELHGTVVQTCQRCMQPADIELDDTFQVILVEEERSDEPGGYEPVVTNPSRLDLAWLAEEQALLALPLVPMHESEDCAAAAASSEIASTEEREDEVEDAEDAPGKTHHPFQNLRDLLRKQ